MHHVIRLGLCKSLTHFLLTDRRCRWRCGGYRKKQNKILAHYHYASYQCDHVEYNGFRHDSEISLHLSQWNQAWLWSILEVTSYRDRWLYWNRTVWSIFTKKNEEVNVFSTHSTKKPVTTMLTYPWKCTVLHCNHLGNTWKPLVLMTRHFDYCPSASEGDNQSVRSSAPVVSRCFPGGYNVKVYISRGRLAWWLLAFLHSEK